MYASFLNHLLHGKLTNVTILQYELGLTVDEGVRQLVEQTDREVCVAEKTVTMKVVASKRAEALHKKMSKLVCMANPKLTDEWL